MFSLLLLTADPSHKIGFGIKLALVCSEPWVECPSHLDLMNIARTFTVQIDPTGLPAGVHTSRYVRNPYMHVNIQNIN
jgi:hypothetical protein